MLVTALCLGLVVAASPASATPPEIERFEASNADTPDVFTDVCGPGVDLIGVFTLRGSATTFFDRDGVPTRVQVHFHFDGELTRSDNGNSVSDPARQLRTIDLTTGEVSDSGVIYAITVPHFGVIAQVAGHKVLLGGETIFDAGPTDIAPDENAFAEVCEALA